LPHIAKIFIYPIKSLDGVAVDRATVLSGGALQSDRELAIVDAQGKFVNAKRHPKIHLVRSQFDLENRLVTLSFPNLAPQVFHLDKERQEMAATLSDFFGLSVQLQENLEIGFPDDLESSGPTVVSTATLTAVSAWFEGESLDQVRRRFRTNIEIDDTPAFWEDRLFGEAGESYSFWVGDVQFKGTYPCQRCPVPTRDALTGEVYPNFQKIFVNNRQANLPEWTATSHFNHFYRLSVNTRIPPSEAGKMLQIGNIVEMGNPQSVN
jgi:uncharacterized protein